MFRSTPLISCGPLFMRQPVYRARAFYRAGPGNRPDMKRLAGRHSRASTMLRDTGKTREAANEGDRETERETWPRAPAALEMLLSPSRPIVRARRETRK